MLIVKNHSGCTTIKKKTLPQILRQSNQPLPQQKGNSLSFIRPIFNQIEKDLKTIRIPSFITENSKFFLAQDKLTNRLSLEPTL